ncbi:hypothetical protein ACOVAC_002472, partial [Enterococcus hirae]
SSSFLLLSFSIILPYLIVDLKLCNRTEIINKGEYVLDIPPEILKGLKNGTYRFVSGKDGVYAQIADKKVANLLKI